MILGDIIDVSKNEIMTVVGAGGKTSFINYFANYYRKQAKVLLTTTTKIYLPQKGIYDSIFMLDVDDNITSLNQCGVTVCGKKINKENKIIGLDPKDLDKIVENFELVLIEGDGSKKKKLKGWNSTEPVVYKHTTITIGILDITSYKMDITEENIHRLDEFINITKCCKGKVSICDLKNIILNPNGLFKNAKGKKILFINKVENNEYEELAKEIINLINKEEHDIITFCGSIKQGYCKNI